MFTSTSKTLLAATAAAAVFSTTIQVADALCPILAARDPRLSIRNAAPAPLPPNHPAVSNHFAAPVFETRDDATTYISKIDFKALEADIIKTLTDSKDFWPADFGNYGPFFIRLAWHCAGSYRSSDGRGGCDGGRIRFDPELSWADNANLDKARQLLEPLKAKYGAALSWGDLIAFTGTTAIKSMGGPTIGFCAGRSDDADGRASLPLGPSSEQEAIVQCPVNGNCTYPLGPTTIGLIYVNPEGHMGIPEPSGSVPDIRASFGRMGMNDRETVALIGGGHSFGKAHGACTAGAGKCGTGPDQGKGRNTFTSGFEGPWTAHPTKWGNDYFDNLLTYNWTVFIGPGGHHQWRPAATDTVEPADAHIRMLTADVALLHDPSYRALVEEYARDRRSLEKDFSEAWYKLTTRDMGPVTRCHGPTVPAPRPFQNPLPARTAPLPNFSAVKSDIGRLLQTDKAAAACPGDGPNGKYYGALFVELAWRCASTFRATDFAGGCNGARIRLAPEKDWPENVGINQVLDVLRPVKAKYGVELSWADLIVLAGQTALEKAGSKSLSFVGGRVDAKDGSNPLPRTYYPNATIAAHDTLSLLNLTAAEYTALSARLRSPTQQSRLGLGSKTYTRNPARLTNDYFKTLLSHKWAPTGVTSKSGAKQYKAVDAEVFVTDADLALVWDGELRRVVEGFAGDEERFRKVFAQGWSKLMTADLF
ncbi:heme peroxidase [Fimicolochytrium jonesii]|uniref:heme peroxidase n=1 Tax=Fimicolochytrium jonesii TaxID=1396493 RepID=UPI0022FE6DE0|nr:heme peroxidase [Fimicolochytrium jonesii]KAI8826211.1 heme peroxidase [Fimicolochytrium jonesii]